MVALNMNPSWQLTVIVLKSGIALAVGFICQIELLGTSGNYPVRPAHVKLNGAYRMCAEEEDCLESSICGINIATVEVGEDGCRIPVVHIFYLWDDTSRSIQLTQFLQNLTYGTLVTGVANDEASRNLLTSTKEIFREDFGVNLEGLGYRHVFAFMGRKGITSETIQVRGPSGSGTNVTLNISVEKDPDIWKRMKDIVPTKNPGLTFYGKIRLECWILMREFSYDVIVWGLDGKCLLHRSADAYDLSHRSGYETYIREVKITAL